jgi:hypothetical protein
MQPLEIGAAAAYEAYRQIKYGQNVYNFLYTDFERQREALHAMAIAEGVSSIDMTRSLTTHVTFLPYLQPSVCGRTRVVQSTNMAYRQHAMLPRGQPAI